jgi:hypothetical protein
MQLTPEMIQTLKDTKYFTSDDIEFWYRNLGIIAAALMTLDPFIEIKENKQLNP